MSTCAQVVERQLCSVEQQLREQVEHLPHRRADRIVAAGRAQAEPYVRAQHAHHGEQCHR